MNYYMGQTFQLGRRAHILTIAAGPSSNWLSRAVRLSLLNWRGQLERTSCSGRRKSKVARDHFKSAPVRQSLRGGNQEQTLLHLRDPKQSPEEHPLATDESGEVRKALSQLGEDFESHAPEFARRLREVLES